MTSLPGKPFCHPLSLMGNQGSWRCLMEAYDVANTLLVWVKNACGMPNILRKEVKRDGEPRTSRYSQARSENVDVQPDLTSAALNEAILPFVDFRNLNSEKHLRTRLLMSRSFQSVILRLHSSFTYCWTRQKFVT